MHTVEVVLPLPLKCPFSVQSIATEWNPMMKARYLERLLNHRPLAV